jgi:hypothetical protein
VATRHCDREAETIRAAWTPGGGAGLSLDADLSAHIARCSTCAGIAALARALREDRDAVLATARPPSAAIVWWRAQRRAREEAARKAARPIAVVHGIALGMVGAAAVAILTLGLGAFRGIIAAAARLLSSADLPALALPTSTSGVPTAAVLMLAASLVLAPVAIYLALSEK